MRLCPECGGNLSTYKTNPSGKTQNGRRYHGRYLKCKSCGVDVRIKTYEEEE